MARHGWLIWKGRFVEWKHSTVASEANLSYSPHFEITVMDVEKNLSKRVFFDNVQVKGELRKVGDLLELPKKEQEGILNSAVLAWEREFGKGAKHAKA